ncbi:lactonase family protein [Devosia rhodophyticola]|uniref:Lactonase family protein n=1 Tax=Devosia rhodophyticola TaxID=3026423 RepID=A0ABY7Z0L5_9HYPH|nr:lactonase family protein [Devosia rhodophyticola]WDR06868.1 lactonase family protein [Devosia rhodophyticola]
MSIYAFAGSLTRSMPQYGAANGVGITQFELNENTGQLVPRSVFGDIEDSSWLVTNGTSNRLYATCEITGTDQSAVAAFSIDPTTGQLSPLGSQPTQGSEVCHAALTRDERFLLVANYNGAPTKGWPDKSVAVFPLAPDGKLLPAVCIIAHSGNGPNSERQTRAHAHCIIPAPDGSHVYVADLGADRLAAYRLGDDGILTALPERDIRVPAGLGPRHIVFHPDGQQLFMVSELTPTVMRFGFDKPSDALRLEQSIPITAGRTAITQPAGIVLSPDNRHLLVSLRVSDDIIGFSIDADNGALVETGRWPCGGKTPRALAFTPSGKHVVVANQDSDNISVFAFDPQSGELRTLVHQQPTGSPMTVAFASV